MKRVISIGILGFILGLINVGVSFSEEPFDTVKGYVNALKGGDVNAMKSFMAGEFYANRKVLIEKNKKYGSFLKDFYERGDLKVGEDDLRVVDVVVQFPDGSQQMNRLILKQDDIGNWKIIDEIPKVR